MERIYLILCLVVLLVLKATAEVFNIENVPSQAPAFCNQETSKGACRAIFTRYQYNATAGKCVMFTYGGCGASKNLFLNEEDCTKVCVRAPEHQRAFGSSDQDCSFEINPARQCGLGSVIYDVTKCVGLTFVGQTEEECISRGCCFIPGDGFCYQKKSALAPTTCKVHYASESGFQGRVLLQAYKSYPAGWTGYLSFRKSVTGAFCILNYAYSPRVEVTEVLQGRKGFIIRGQDAVSAGQTLTIFYSGSFGNSNFTSSQCQVLNHF